MQSPYFTAGLRVGKGLCRLTDAELELVPGPLEWSLALLPYVESHGEVQVSLLMRVRKRRREGQTHLLDQHAPGHTSSQRRINTSRC